MIEKAGNKGSKIVLLPEAFIPAYPRGFTFGMKIGSRNEEGRALWKRYWENAIETSVIIAPSGEIIAGPLWDEEGILYADLDLDEITKAKIDFDAVGHYARPDIFQLNVNREPQVSITFNPKKNA